MKTSIKYSKWLLSAAILATAPVFTACDDDDVTYVTPLPDKFSTVLSSLNVEWNETEGVVDFEAPGKWKAESASEWIEVDPTKGDAGGHRLWLNITPNPYMLPRTGEIHITCGEEYGKIVVTQAGAPADQVAPTSNSLEVLSLDYAAEEINLSSAASDIMGNLGLTLDEFSKGVDDDGNLEFFMVGKNGEWVSGGTAGTRCSAWLDKDLNVTWWDGSGYPANAAFIEVYGGEDPETHEVSEPVVVVGRAPGVPDNQEYDLVYGFTFANDHSKYIIFNTHVIFVPMDLKGTVVRTYDMTVNVEANDGYQATPATFNAAEVAAALGASNITLAKVVSYDSNGDFIDYTANNGYWFDQKGQVGSWGEGAGWFIEYWGGEDGDEEANSSWMVGPFPGVSDVSATSKIGFWYNNNVVMFNLKIVIGEGGNDEPVEPSAAEVIDIRDIKASIPAVAYSPEPFAFDAESVCSKLGISSLGEAQVVSLNEAGEVLGMTGNNGYWFNAEGDVCSWGTEGFSWFAEYWFDPNEPDQEVYNKWMIGAAPDVTGITSYGNIGFMANGKVVLFNLEVTIQ